MSDIRQRAKRKNKKCQIWFSYFLFSTLIVFDIFAILSAIGVGVGVLLLLAEQVDDEDEGGPSIFYPLATAIIFNIAWLFVCSIFKELIKHQQVLEVRAGPVED